MARSFLLGGLRAAGRVAVETAYKCFMRTVDFRRRPRLLSRFSTFSPIALLASALALFGQTSSPPGGKSGETGLLEPGKPIERELAGGEFHAYGIRVNAGEYARIVVEERGIEVSLTGSIPGGGPAMAFECSVGSFGTQELHVIAPSAGMVQMEVRAAKPEDKRARYSIRLEELRPADAREKTRVAAAADFAEAVRLRSDQKEESQRKAIELFEEAAGLWQAAGLPGAEAASWNGAGEVYEEVGEGHKALACHERALPLRRAAKDRNGEALTLSNIGLSHHGLGEVAKALDDHDRSLEIYRAAGDRQNEAGELISLGSIQDEQGESEKGLSLTREAEALLRSTGDREPQAAALNNIATILGELGRTQESLDTLLEALGLVRQIGMRRGEAILLGNIGVLYRDLGELDTAEAYVQESFALRRKLGDRRGQASEMSKIAGIEVLRGRREKALKTLSAALVLQRELDDHAGETATLRRIGRAQLDAGSPTKAERSLKSAMIAARQAGDAHVEASILIELADAQAAARQTGEALATIGKAVESLRSLGDSAALSRALVRLARLRQEAGDIEAARGPIEEAIGIAESSRAALTSRTLRLAYPGAVHEIYEAAVDLFVALHERQPSGGFGARAFEASERMRARSLLEMLEEAHVDLREGGEPKLIDRARVLERLLAARGEAQVRVLATKSSPQETAALAKEIDKLASEYDEVESKIRARNPRYAAIALASSPRLADLQKLLGPDDLLLEYAFSERRGILFAITPEALSVRSLTGRRSVDRAARATLELLRRPGGGEEGRLARQRLSKMVLGPVADLIGKRRLLIVPDGALHFVPFGALPTPGKGGSAAPPLLSTHEVVSLPSASVLEVLRRETAGREPAAKMLAVFADPVFDRRDERVLSGRGATSHRSPNSSTVPRPVTAAPSSLERSLRDADAAAVHVTLARLPFTRREADGILELVPPGERLRALDFDASKATATSPAVGSYRLVHFATHALLNTSHPDLSGVVLSLVGPSGQKEDGFLSALDVFRLNLPADLVVLSACRTALGKEVHGEGLVGLTQAFMYAGAPRVVASLWRVDDLATAELMKRFYQGMLGPKKLRPAAALREAQLAMRKQARWRDPFYWAAFVLQGEWN